jgi:hypothetical protein
MAGRDARTASGTLAAMVKLPSGQMQAIASYAVRAL